MSNDRILLLCRCGELKLLAKYYPGVMGDPATLDGWIDKHVHKCHPTPFDGDLGGYIPFTLTTEEIFKHCERSDDGTYRLKNLET